MILFFSLKYLCLVLLETRDYLRKKVWEAYRLLYTHPLSVALFPPTLCCWCESRIQLLFICLPSSSCVVCFDTFKRLHVLFEGRCLHDYVSTEQWYFLFVVLLSQFLGFVGAIISSHEPNPLNTMFVLSIMMPRKNVSPVAWCLSEHVLLTGFNDDHEKKERLAFKRQVITR